MTSLFLYDKMQTWHLTNDLNRLGDFLNDEGLIHWIHRCYSGKQIALMRRNILWWKMIKRKRHDVLFALLAGTAIGTHAQNIIDVLLDEFFHGVLDRHIPHIPNTLNIL